MPEINTPLVRDIVRFFDADGIQDSDPANLNRGTPDGYLSVAELRAGIERVQGEFSRWREANQYKVTPIIIFEQHEQMTRKVSALESAIPTAAAA